MNHRSSTFCALSVVAIGSMLAPRAARADEIYYGTMVWDGIAGHAKTGTIRSVDEIGSNDVLVVDEWANKQLPNPPPAGLTTWPTPSPEGDFLYFESKVSGSTQIYRTRPDGSGLEDLIQGRFPSSAGATPSADGQRLLFTMFKSDGTPRVVLANPDGSAPTIITDALGYSYMGSPDRTGSRAVFANQGESYTVWAYGSGGLTRLTTANSYIPQFTPNGSQIVFQRGPAQDGSSRHSEFRIMNWNGTSERVLASMNGYDALHWNANDTHGSSDGFDFAPDGQSMAYVANVGGVSQVHTIDLNVASPTPRQITRLPGNCARARFSPDGKRIAFASRVGSLFQLFVTNADGSGIPRQLTSRTTQGVFWVAWKPTGLMTVRNVTARKTIFADDFAHVPAASNRSALDFSGDYDPVAIAGSWDVYEAPWESGTHTIYQVTRSTQAPDPGAFRGRNYLRVYRSLANGKTGQNLTGRFTAPQSVTGDLIRWSMMVNIPDDRADTRAAFFMSGKQDDYSTARVRLRTDGAGNVVSMAPDGSLRQTGVRYKPGTWQRWDIEYAIGSNTFSVAVNGSRAAGLLAYTAGPVNVISLHNGNNSTGSFYVGGIPATLF